MQQASRREKEIGGEKSGETTARGEMIVEGERDEGGESWGENRTGRDETER